MRLARNGQNRIVSKAQVEAVPAKIRHKDPDVAYAANFSYGYSHSRGAS